MFKNQLEKTSNVKPYKQTNRHNHDLYLLPCFGGHVCSNSLQFCSFVCLRVIAFVNDFLATASFKARFLTHQLSKHQCQRHWLRLQYLLRVGLASSSSSSSSFPLPCGQHRSLLGSFLGWSEKNPSVEVQPSLGRGVSLGPSPLLNGRPEKQQGRPGLLTLMFVDVYVPKAGAIVRRGNSVSRWMAEQKDCHPWAENL